MSAFAASDPRRSAHTSKVAPCRLLPSFFRPDRRRGEQSSPEDASFFRGKDRHRTFRWRQRRVPPCEQNVGRFRSRRRTGHACRKLHEQSVCLRDRDANVLHDGTPVNNRIAHRRLSSPKRRAISLRKENVALT